MKKTIVDPSCYSSLYRNEFKTAHISRPHKYKDGVFKFFINVAGKVKEFTFRKLKSAAKARQYFASKFNCNGYMVTQ